MSRIVGVTLLLILLIDCFYHSTASRTPFRVEKKHIRMCRCHVFNNGKTKCRSTLLPRNTAEKRDLLKCLCSKASRQKFPEFNEPCSSWRPNFPITLL